MNPRYAGIYSIRQPYYLLNLKYSSIKPFLVPDLKFLEPGNWNFQWFKYINLKRFLIKSNLYLTLWLVHLYANKVVWQTFSQFFKYKILVLQHLKYPSIQLFLSALFEIYLSTGYILHPDWCIYISIKNFYNVFRSSFNKEYM